MFLLYGSVTVSVHCDTDDESNHISGEEWVLLCVRNNLYNISMLPSPCPVGASPSWHVKTIRRQKTLQTSPCSVCYRVFVVVKEMQLTGRRWYII